MNVCVSEMAGGEAKNASANWEQRMLSLSFDPVFFCHMFCHFYTKLCPLSLLSSVHTHKV